MNLAEATFASFVGPSEITATVSVLDVCTSGRAKLLVVEDDPQSAKILMASLSTEEFCATWLRNAENVALVVEDQKPDLIICDILLPGVDGIQLTRELREKPSTQAVPILLVTSLDDRKVISRGLEAGADDVLIKPIHALELRTRVKSLLRNRSAAEELRVRGDSASSFVHTENNDVDVRSKSIEQPREDYQPNQPTVLLVEDDQKELRRLSLHLQEVGARIITANNIQSAIRAFEEQRVDLAVLDLLLPDGVGFSLIEHIQRTVRHFLVPIPVLVVSGMAAVQDRVKALELGADDFIVKGFDALEFRARVQRLLRKKQKLDQLSLDYDKLVTQAVTDSLTGLRTHGFLKDTLQNQVECGRRYGWPLSVLFLDIDHFKAINDQHGHGTGDEVLRMIGGTIRRTIRGADVAVRYGGEEFVVVLPHTDRQEAESLAERLRCAIAERGGIRLSSGGKVNATVSVGVATFPKDASDSTTLLQYADKAMFMAKRAGRNRVVGYQVSELTAHDQPQVLIADDDPRNLRLLEAYLGSAGYRTIRAMDGQEAIAVARHERPDLIVLDGMMPRVSGFEACRQIKEDHDLRLIPVLLVTALGGREDRLRGIESGADEFLTKPVDKVALLSRMRALLRTKRTTDLLEDAEIVIFALARAVESRDPSTGGHVERVSRYAAMLGRAAGLAESQIEGLRRAGVVHDIGKIVIPDNVLLKPGKLTAEERKLIQSHVEVGYELLRPMRTFTESLPAVRFHHERLDGSGYPLGLRNEQVPVTAQILAIVDVFDALTTDRPYRVAMTHPEAFCELRKEASRGMHDAKLIDLFESILT